MRDHWEHFEHSADIGVRGMGSTKAAAFEQAALALTGIVTPPGGRGAARAGCHRLRGAGRRTAARRLAQRARLRDGDAAHAVRPLPGAPRRPPAGRPGLGRAGDRSSATSRRSRSRARPTPRCASRPRQAAAGWRKPWWTSDHGPEPAEAARPLRVGDPAAGRDARAGRDLRERSAGARDGPQGLRAGGQRGVPARHRAARATRCPTRTGATASRSAASRRSTPTPAASSRPAASASTSPAACAACTPACVATTSSPCSGRSPTRCSRTSRRASAAPARSTSTSAEMDAMLAGGARWAVERGWGTHADLERIEERGQMLHAKPGKRVGAGQAAPARRDGHARQRQPLPRGAGGRRGLRRGHRRRLRPGAGRHRGHDPLRLARPRATRSAPSS